MEWSILREQFEAATRQDRAPFGEDAIEWDYSRYSRALGLTGLPSLRALPVSSCAMIAASPAGWGKARNQFGGWAGDAGWTLLPVSARPLVSVPDAFVHSLGRAVAGPRAPLFFRDGRSGAPAQHARPRPA